MKLKLDVGETEVIFSSDIQTLDASQGPAAYEDAASPTGVLRVERGGATVDEITGAPTTNVNELYAEYTPTEAGTEYLQWRVTAGGKTRIGQRLEVEIREPIAAEE